MENEDKPEKRLDRHELLKLAKQSGFENDISVIVAETTMVFEDMKKRGIIDPDVLFTARDRFENATLSLRTSPKIESKCYFGLARSSSITRTDKDEVSCKDKDYNNV